VAECLTEEEDYVLWRDQYDWSQKEQVMDEMWRADKEAGIGGGDDEEADESKVEEVEAEEEQYG
jgi:hypothetical protein